MSKIIISVVSHGQQDLVQKFLESADQFLVSNEHQVQFLVTENLDDEIDIASKVFDLNVSYNLRQKGFGDNHNSAFEKFHCDYFIVANPDIELYETLDCDEIIRSLGCVDIACPVIVGRDMTPEDYIRADLSVWNLMKRHLFNYNEKKQDWFAGMFLIFKASSFRTLSGFDTKFFMYVEDCDICMRARDIGMKLKALDNASVLHSARRTSRKKLRYLYWHIKSLVKYWCSRR